ncbi:MAG: hypothetical protein KatS3mg102_2330 [Planctomycetota bacterium]|nr:MAG: hypothetical protein KatS3mg102_2330 [Planctomycetota bacterium]
MVHLQKLHERYAEQGLLVYAIAVHPDRAEAIRLTRELGIGYPVLWGTGSELVERYAYG